MAKIFTLLFLFSISLVFSQNNPADSLKKILEIEKVDTLRLQLLDELVNYYSNYDLSLAAGYAGQGVRLAEKISNKPWIAKLYQKKGRAHANSLQLDSAMDCFEKAIATYKDINDKKGQASTTFKVAWVHKRRGETDKALENDLAALKLFEEVDDKRGICDAYTRISDDLKRQDRLKEASEYAEKAIALSEQYNLESEIYYVNVQAGDIYMAKGDFKKSYESYLRAYDKSKADNASPSHMTDVSVSVGNALKRLKRYPEALQKYEEAHAFAKSVNYENGYGATLANLGEVNMILGNYKVALNYQLQTIAHMEKTHEAVNLVENYQHVSTTYEKLKDYPSSLKYQRKALKVRDSLASVESDRAMAEMLTKYETEKKEATIATQATELDQQQRIQWLGAGVLVLLAGFIVFGIIAFLSRAKKNKLLAIKNGENELLLKEIHHRVKNNLEVVSSLLALQSAKIDDVHTKEAMLESQNRVNSIGIVHQKLYQGENLGAIEMKDYFLNLSASIIDTFSANEKVQLELAMDKLSVDIDTAVPLGLIVNELLTNALKYAFREGQKGVVKISLQKQADGVLHLEVADNGVGKSSTVQGTGFGTQLIQLLTKQLNGIMQEDNANGMKVVFDFRI
jgi:two-component sensor histidine kinase